MSSHAQKRTPEIEILQENVVYENQYGRLCDDDVRFLPSGAVGTYVRWTWKAPFSVAVLPITGGSTALLVNNYRHSARGAVLEAVKGFGAPGITPESVARTELQEEIGYECTQLDYLGPLVTDAAFNWHPMHCFLASGYRTGTNRPEDSEAILGIEEVDIESAAQLFRSGRLQDAATLFLLWQAQHRKGERP